MMKQRRRGYDDGNAEAEDDWSGAADASGKRRKTDATQVEDRLEVLIAKIGDNPTALEANLEGLAGVLEADMGTMKDRIKLIVMKCVLDMPEKLTVYTTLVGLLNAKVYTFGGDFMELLLTSIKERLNNDDYDNAIVLIILLCDLVNSHVISALSCLSFLNSLLETTQEMDISQTRSDWYVYATLITMPWVGRELSDKVKSGLSQLLGTIESYMEKRQKLYVPLLTVWSSSKPHVQEEYLDCLWAQVQKLKEEMWQEKHIGRPYASFDPVLSDALQHNVPKFVVPEHHSYAQYPLPRVVFRMFDFTDCPEEGSVLPGSHSIERALLELELTWIIRLNHLERKDCANSLVSYPKRHKVPLNYAVLEVIFGQLFNLPKPPHLELFYGSLLIELCKLQPNSMPQVLAQAAEMLYQRIDSMAPTCFDRFVDWFAYHLSNFQFRWSWEDWTDCLTLDPISPKQMFVREVLHKCMRFSYHQRVLDIVPSSFAPLVPPKPVPVMKYSQDSSQGLPGAAIAQQLANLIRNRAPVEEISNALKECPNPAGVDIGDGGFNPLKVDVLVLTLLQLGTKSFSHTFAALAKYHSPLKELTDGNEEAQRTVLHSAYDMWINHHQMLVVLVDKLLKMQIVTCPAVINWLFSKEMQPDFVRMYVWEIMRMTLVKMSKHISKMRADLSEAQAQRRVKTDIAEGEELKMEADESDDVIERLTESVEAAENEQKNLLLMLFQEAFLLQKFTILLTEHLMQCEADATDYNSFWYRWVVGRLREIFLVQHIEAAKYRDTLEQVLFSSDVDSHILDVFLQFKAMMT